MAEGCLGKVVAEEVFAKKFNANAKIGKGGVHPGGESCSLGLTQKYKTSLVPTIHLYMSGMSLPEWSILQWPSQLAFVLTHKY